MSDDRVSAIEHEAIHARNPLMGPCMVCVERATCGSDRKKLLALLKDFGVIPECYEEEGSQYVMLKAGSAENVRGYSDFVCNFRFDETGNFRDVGVWE